MRLATVEVEGKTVAARVEGNVLTLLPFSDVGAVLRSGPDWREVVEEAEGPCVGGSEVRVKCPVLQPGKILCAGLNYRSHFEETGADKPRHPEIFVKYPEALIGPGEPITLPRAAPDRVDWEVELVAVVGQRARHATVEEADDVIAGFTIGNDVSMRDFQLRTSQWLLGKTWAQSTPLGPVMVTADECGGVLPDLEITLDVDGQRMQSSRTGDLLFNTSQLVAQLSEVLPLLPGDLIFTGTPAGIGAARKPPMFLRPGQVVRASIDGIGYLENMCRLEDDGPFSPQSPQIQD